MKKGILSSLIACFLLVAFSASAQVGQYRLAYNSGTQTYTVYAKMDQSYTVPLSRFINLFVTIMAPHGTGAALFVPTNITTDAALATSNVMAITRIDGPTWQPSKDYLFCNFNVGSGNYTPADIVANTEFPVFTFKSQNGCVGDLYLIVHGSAEYIAAQANSQNASNSFFVLGAGADAYSTNYSTNVSCAALVPPTITTSISPSPMTAGTPATLTLTATNSAGNPAQTGLGYTYTLPTGLSFPAGSTVTNSCGGTGTISGNTVTFSGGSIASGTASCTLSMPVVAAAAGTINPATGSFTSPVAVTIAPNNGAGASPTTVTVNPPTPPTITTAISPSPMTAGTPATLSITATNSAGNPAQTGLGYTYTVPTGLTIPAGSTVTNSCGGTGTISGNTVTFTGGTMASGTASCVVSVPVVAAAAGTVNPSTGSFTSPSQVTIAPNNGAGASPAVITVNPAACAANAGVLGY
jgi:hypothetical protein